MKKVLNPLIVSITLFASSFSSMAQTDPKGLMKGDKAPNFEATDLSGSKIKLSDILKTGDVVLVFYRGQWCPYCNKYLSKLEDSLKMIKAKGATLIAISPETSEGVKETVKKTKASYPVLHDEGMKIMTMYKVNYALTDNMLKTYKDYGMDFNKLNGTNGNNLPVPATYIIGKNGIIKSVFFNPDFTQRAPVKDILDQL